MTDAQDDAPAVDVVDTQPTTFGASRANPSHFNGNKRIQQGRKDLNPVRKFWRLAALPGAHPCLV